MIVHPEDVLSPSRLDGQRTALRADATIRGVVNTLEQCASEREGKKEGWVEGGRDEEGRVIAFSRLKQSGPLRQQFLRARVQLTTHVT